MYLEDLQPGQRAELGSHTFSEAEIIAFARAYDPQPFHVDPAAAARSPYGGIIASGWHTCAIWMRLTVALLSRQAMAGQGGAGPSPGFRDLLWPNPVRPGDTVTYSTEVIEARPSASRPGWGLLTALQRGVNQKGEEVMSFVSTVFVPRRPTDA